MMGYNSRYVLFVRGRKRYLERKVHFVGKQVMAVVGLGMIVLCAVLAWRHLREDAELADVNFMSDLCEHGEQETCEYCLGQMLEYVRPSVVQLYCDISENKYTAASGFIIEISDADIYICSNRHVVEGYKDWIVYFYDGTAVKGDIVGLSDQYDVAVISVPMEYVPTEVQRGLKAVEIDMNAWYQLGTEAFDVGLLRVNREGEVMYTLLGQVLRVKIDFPWGNGLQETELDIDQTAGDSGSAYFDSKGRLIAMVHGNSEDGGGERNWGIPLDGIVLSYEEITGRTLY